MRGTILSAFAAAALLSLAADGSAIEKTGRSFPLSGEPLHPGSVGRIAGFPEPASAHRSVRTAQIVFDHSGLIVSPVAGKDSKKGFSGSRQGGGAATAGRGGRPVHPSTQVNISSGIVKGASTRRDRDAKLNAIRNVRAIRRGKGLRSGQRSK